MYILKNALRNVFRNKGRNILLALIMLAIITTSVTALIINNTAAGIIDDYKGRFGSEVTITPDTQKLMTTRGSGGPQTGARISIAQITPQQLLDFSDSEYLLETVFTANQMVGSETLDAYGTEDDGGLNGGRGQFISPGVDLEGYVTPEFRLLGGEWDDFDSGMRVIDSGRMVEADNECVISAEFAEANALAPGDVIEVTGSTLAAEGEELVNTVYTLTVVGIYLDLTEEDSTGMFISSLMNRRNEILVSFETLAAPVREKETGARIEAVFYLKEPSMLEAFAAEVRAKGLSEDYIVTTDETGYNTVVGPVAGMKNITLTFLIVVLVLGAIILLLLSSIAIRERKYEIGVLRAMGMKKHKVAAGLWSEMLMITCVCAVLGLAVGTVVAQPVSDMLLADQIERAEEASTPTRGGMQMVIAGGRTNADYTALDSLDVSLGAGTLFEIIGISLLLATAAALAAVVKITKYEPIKILMERT